MGGKMRVARIVVAVVATIAAALAVVGTASADPPGMTYNSSVPGMTYNNMTYN
jgi:type IV secretory pathway protease TraF